MKTNSFTFMAISLIFASLVSACDPETEISLDKKYEMTCTNTECKFANRTLKCSDDGAFIYEYYDESSPDVWPAGLLNPKDFPVGLSSEADFGLFYNNIVDRTDKTFPLYKYECRKDYYLGENKCRIINNTIGCYQSCGVQQAGETSWCEPYSWTDHHIFKKGECVLDPSNGKYYSKKTTRHFCPSDRTCDNNSGCIAYTSEDGTSCSSGYDSTCIEENGQSYARVCKTIISSDEKFYTVTPCELCSLGENNNFSYLGPYNDPYCLERCGAEGAYKVTCAQDDTYGYSTKWKCNLQSNGQTFWNIESSEICPRGCEENGQCKKYPGEGEPCSASTYQSKCIGETEIMTCSNSMSAITYQTMVMDCNQLGSILGFSNLICLETENGAKCVEKDNTVPCLKEGQKTTSCIQLSDDDGSDDSKQAYTVQYICTKFSDGSLRNVIVDDISSSLHACSSRECNESKTGCK